MKPTHFTIAIDGPAASGKSTVARQVARCLGLRFFSTGECYRAATWIAVNELIALDDAESIVAAMIRRELRVAWRGESAYVSIDGNDLGDQLRSAAVNAAVSRVSSLPKVRRHLVSLQQAAAAEHSLVLEGRDIGTVVCPDTPYKFYIDASPEVRQRRREAEGQRDQVTERDRADSKRADSPLAIAQGAIHIDTSHLSINEVVDLVLAHVARIRQQNDATAS